MIVLGLKLYTADVIVTNRTISSFADNTAIISSVESPITVSQNLQAYLKLLRLPEDWPNNETSRPLYYHKKKRACPLDTLNNIQHNSLLEV